MSHEQLLEQVNHVEQKDKVSRYNELVAAWVKAADTAALRAFVSHIVALGERGAVVVSRPAIRDFVAAIEALSNADAETVGRFALDALRPRAVYYGDEIVPLARLLSEVFQANDRFLEAAKVLAQVDLSQARNVTSAFKAEWFISTSEMFNAAGDTVSASSCISLAHREMVLYQSPTTRFGTFLHRLTPPCFSLECAPHFRRPTCKIRS